MTLAAFLASNPVVLLALAFILGLLIGSFLNVVIYRLPLMMERDWREQCHEFLELSAPVPEGAAPAKFNLAEPGSHCPHCKHAIGASENIPVLSYVIQGGKCAHCKNPISPRYPLLETVTAIFSTIVVANFGLSWLTLALLIFTWTLIVLTMIDLDRQLLPDDITLPLLWLGLIINSMGMLTSLENAVWGALAGYLILWSIYWAFKLLTGKEGMGYGDFKLLAALGAWLGWQALPQIILLSSLVGAVVGISMIVLKGRDKNVPIPFGPYLASAGFLALLWGDDISAFFFIFMV
jgi:leader peptidase (prepilin peptidase)/N-methyltransferase